MDIVPAAPSTTPLLSDVTVLNPFPGAPFAPSLVASAVDSVRSIVGWHIAPVITETRWLWCKGGTLLALPTLKLDPNQTASVVAGGQTYLPDHADPDGLLYRLAGWPFGRVAVTFTHGFAQCPPELLPILAEKASEAGRDASVAQESVLSRSVTYRPLDPVSALSVLARYTL